MKQYNNKIAFFFATLGWWVLNIISYVLRAIPFAISIVCHGIALLMLLWLIRFIRRHRRKRPKAPDIKPIKPRYLR